MITNSIISTVAVHDETISSMRKALEAGKSVEAWFQEETAPSQQSAGQQTYILTDIHTAVGHFVGGAVGKMAGTAVGSKIVETAKKVSTAAKTVVSRVTSTVRSIGNTIRSGLRSLFSW